MPRTRRRRRRRSGSEAASAAPQPNPQPETLTAQITPSARRIPSASVVLALCLGVWIGLALSADGVSTLPEIVALWVSVIGAGLAAGRLLRRWLQRRNR